MEQTDAVKRLAALAHDGRLSIVRELAKAGPDGLAAGEVGRRLSMLANTLSANLLVLSHAGLVQSRRDGRSVIYSAAYPALGELLRFLVEDCCEGRPEVCVAMVATAQACCSRRDA